MLSMIFGLAIIVTTTLSVTALAFLCVRGLFELGRILSEPSPQTSPDRLLGREAAALARGTAS